MPPAGTSPIVVLGALVNTHGLRGELRLLPHNPDTEAVQPGVRVLLRRGSEQHAYRVAAARRHKRFVLVTLEGVDSIAAAEALVGCELCVPRDALPSLEAGEVYHFELVGLGVVTTDGSPVGTITEVFSTPANDVCVVDAGGREILIPLIDDVLARIDVEAGVVTIVPLPGLLDA
jgi:16S rRNA processing protein RimM